MGPDRFMELLEERQQKMGGDTQARLRAVGTVGGFSVGVVDETYGHSVELVIANQTEGDDTSAVYPAARKLYGPRYKAVGVGVEGLPVASNLSEEDRAKLGRMARVNADPDEVIIPDEIEGVDPATALPSRFLGYDITPFEEAVE